MGGAPAHRPLTAAPLVPPTAAPAAGVDRPGYFWPDSLGGSMFYFVALAACGFGGYFLAKQIALEEPELGLQGREYIGSAVCTLAGFLLLLFLRNVCIASGLIAKPQVGAPATSGKASGGVNVIGIILLVFGAGLARKCTLDSINKQRRQNQAEQWKKNLRKPDFRPRTTRPPTRPVDDRRR